MKRLQKILWLAALLLPLGAATACSESDDEEAVQEFANWQNRNNAFFATLEDSLSHNAAAWKKLKTYTKDENTAGVNTDYIYVKVIEAGSSDASPLYSDSVRIAYRGRLIPSITYPQGYVFDQTFVGDYNIKTTAVYDGVVSSFVDGFTTALQHMHRGDWWRVYIPYTLGYGVSTSGSIPGYSVLVFDLVLIDFVSGKGAFAPWSSRQF